MFCSQFCLNEVSMEHPTYHHFVGESASFLDRILFSSNIQPELLKNIHCKLSEPFINSHHDMLISSWSVPHMSVKDSSEDNIVAPKAINKRLKVVWCDAGVEEYQRIVTPHLSRLQNLWLTSPTRSQLSLLLEATNNLLSASAARTNKTISLDGSSKSKRKNFTPRTIRTSQNSLLKKYKHFQKVLSSGDTSKIASLKKDYNKARDLHRKLERMYKAGQSSQRDETLFSICTSNPSPIFKSIKSSKRSTAGKIQKLSVGHKVYLGDSVQDGFL